MALSLLLWPASPVLLVRSKNVWSRRPSRKLLAVASHSGLPASTRKRCESAIATTLHRMLRPKTILSAARNAFAPSITNKRSPSDPPLAQGARAVGMVGRRSGCV